MFYDRDVRGIVSNVNASRRNSRGGVPAVWEIIGRRSAFDFPFLPGDRPRGSCPMTHNHEKKEYLDVWERRAARQ